MMSEKEYHADYVRQHVLFGLSVAFRDTDGRHWQRLPNGKLQRIEDHSAQRVRERAAMSWDRSALCPEE